MQPIRVLVVDDSALMRQMISRILKDAGMEVVATARDGVDALEKVAQHRPDVITLDVEMPRMDGLETLRRLMRESPLPVVMLSSLTQEQAPTAIEALAIGAVDVVGKPGGTISLNIGEIAEEIVRKVRAAATARVGRAPGFSARSGALPRPEGQPTGVESPGASTWGASGRGAARSYTARPGVLESGTSSPGAAALHAASSSAPQPARAPGAGSLASHERTAGDDAFWRRSRGRERGRSETPLVVVGSSTGGPKALTQLLSPLPQDFPAPIVVVQHMPAGFTKALAERLDDGSALQVAEAVPGQIPRPGEVWVARGGVHLTFDARKAMQEDRSPPHMGVRPAVDITLESAVLRWQGRVIAVILTGMGMDGARGCRKVKQAGGIVLAQDEESSVIYGMPRAVAEMGLADRIESIDVMADVLTETVEAAMKRWTLG